MGYDKECKEAYQSIAEDFGVNEEPVYGYFEIIAAVKTLAHYSTAPECEELAARLRMIELLPDPDDETQMAILRSLPVDQGEECSAHQGETVSVHLQPLDGSAEPLLVVHHDSSGKVISSERIDVDTDHCDES